MSGPLDGRDEQALLILDEMGNVSRIPEYIDAVKAGTYKLIGFGHRVYKNYDPRARGSE